MMKPTELKTQKINPSFTKQCKCNFTYLLHERRVGERHNSSLSSTQKTRRCQLLLFIYSAMKKCNTSNTDYIIWVKCFTPIEKASPL